MISNFFFQEMNNTKRIHSKKFYIPLYIPPLNFFRKYNSSILILIHRAPNFPGIKSREKHLKAFFSNNFSTLLKKSG